MDDALTRIRCDLEDLMMVPGLSGHEQRVAAIIREKVAAIGFDDPKTDTFGNVSVVIPGDYDTVPPALMVFAHMDQLGFVVRKIRKDGLIRVERLGGVPERALAAQPVILCVAPDRDVPGLITNKAHHATSPQERYEVVRAPDLLIDAGFASKQEAENAGVRIGTPVVYRPHVQAMGPNRVAGTSVDDRAGCAVLLELARRLKDRQGSQEMPTVNLVFTVQEEFNLRGALTAAQAISGPSNRRLGSRFTNDERNDSDGQLNLAIQIDLMLATDTPDMDERGDMVLGGGPGMSLYSFHGRGTLNGVIPHPRLVNLMEEVAAREGIELQRSAQVGVLTDLSYVQHIGAGVACIDMGFPMRYSHSALECCDLRDLAGLTDLLAAAIPQMGRGFSIRR